MTPDKGRGYGFHSGASLTQADNPATRARALSYSIGCLWKLHADGCVWRPYGPRTRGAPQRQNNSHSARMTARAPSVRKIARQKIVAFVSLFMLGVQCYSRLGNSYIRYSHVVHSHQTSFV